MALRVIDTDAAHVDLEDRCVGQSLQHGAVAGEYRELRARCEPPRNEPSTLRQRHIDFRNSLVGEVAHQRKQDHDAGCQRQEQYARPDAPLFHGSLRGVAPPPVEPRALSPAPSS